MHHPRNAPGRSPRSGLRTLTVATAAVASLGLTALAPHQARALTAEATGSLDTVSHAFASGPRSTPAAGTVLNVPGTYPTVQSAINAVPDNNTRDITVAIAPGTYREKVFIPATKPHVTLKGTGARRSDALVVFDTPAQFGGSDGSATVRIAANDVTASNLTFSNDFDEAAHDYTGEQALAMKTTGDRIVFENTAFLGNQDTLMTDSPKLDAISRVYIRDSFIQGDVDFIYGRATTVVEHSTIKALSRGSTSNNGYLTAASTWKNNRYGILITGSKVISDAPAHSFHLGRPWHPGGEPNAVAQVLIRESELPAAIKSSPWADMSGFSWKDARLTEYHNYGPGAGRTADRPQMSDADAAVHQVANYLAGSDGWAPQRRQLP